MRFKILFGVGICLSLITMSACSHNSKENHPKDTLRVAVDGEAPTLDPALADDIISSRIMDDLFAGLVDYTQDNQIIPGLAKDWSISADKKTYTFHLQPNLKFSNGESLTANDVVFSLRRLIDPKLGSDYNFLLAGVVGANDIINGKASPSTLGVKAIDANTVVITLIQPDAYFLNYLALPNAFVVSQKNITKYGSAWTKPANMVTSGAYSLKEHVVNGYILATKNPYFYGAKDVSIAKVKYFPYVDLSTSVSSYRNGALDMTFQNVPTGQYKDLLDNYKGEIYTIPQEAMFYYSINTRLAKFANVKLRQALSMAIDRKVLTDKVLAQGQIPLYSLVTPSVEGGKFAGVKYDWSDLPTDQRIAKARQLYKEAGFGPNKPLTITIAYNTNETYKKVSLAIAEMWKSTLGVHTKLRNQEWKTFLNTRKEGNFEIARDGWVADYNGVTSYTNNYLCHSLGNYTGLCDQAYDKLISQAATTGDATQRSDLYSAAIKQALADYAIIPVYQYVYVRMVKPYIKNYTIKVNNLDHVQSKWFKFSS